MQAPDEHKEHLRRQNFVFRCRNIFSHEEQQILLRYGCWMEALATGVIRPVTPAEERFLLVDRGQLEPESKYELAWIKLKIRRDYEGEYLESEHYAYTVPAAAWLPPVEDWRYR